MCYSDYCGACAIVIIVMHVLTVTFQYHVHKSSSSSNVSHAADKWLQNDGLWRGHFTTVHYIKLLTSYFYSMQVWLICVIHIKSAVPRGGTSPYPNIPVYHFINFNILAFIPLCCFKNIEYDKVSLSNYQFYKTSICKNWSSRPVCDNVRVHVNHNWTKKKKGVKQNS